MPSPSKRFILFLAVLIPFLLITGYFTEKTGLFQGSLIDSRDSHWKRTTEGIMLGAEPITLAGTRTCWLFVHGYGSTPAEFSTIIQKIHKETNSTILVPLLAGHGRTPSALQEKNWDDWYVGVKASYDSLSTNCDEINAAGSSLGATLLVQLSQERNITTLALLAPYTKAKKPLDQALINNFGTLLHYVKKTKIAAINNEQGQQLHKAYWNLPLKPLQRAQEKISIVELLTPKARMLLVFLAQEDTVVSNTAGEQYYEKFRGKKVIIRLQQSNHVMSLDNDAEEVAREIANAT